MRHYQDEIDQFHEFLAVEYPDLPPLPTHMIVCPECNGHGTKRGYPGVYTQDDFEELGQDFIDDYREHVRTCERCNGNNVIQAVTMTPGDLTPTEMVWQQWLRDLYETDRIEEMERRMGA